MVGGDIHMVRAANTPRQGAVRCSLKDAFLEADGPFAVELKNIYLDVRDGEVIAIAGVAGNGQSELFDAISGNGPSPTAMRIQSRVPLRRDRGQRSGADAGRSSEERLGHGAVPGFKLSENVMLTRHSDDAGTAEIGLLQSRKGEFHLGARNQGL